MTGTLIGALVLVLLAGTGALIATMLGARTAPDLALVAYVVGFAEVVVLFLFLSAFRGVSQAALVAGVVLLFVAAGSVWVLRGTPRPPSLRTDSFRRLASSRPVLVSAIAVAFGLAYVIALIFGTPPNGWDPLNYHLARAAFWLQSGGIRYIEPTYDERLNLNPPDGEIGSAFALGATHEEMLVGFVQFFAALACAGSIFVLARRIGLRPAEAAFGAILFLTLPIVALQESVAKNDLVMASFLLAATVFLLGDSRPDLVLAGLATALAVGTKSTALYGLPILLGVALVARPRTRRVERAAGVAAGALIGSYWYAVNLAETGHFFGDQSAQQAVTAVLQPPEDLVTALGIGVDTLDLSGAVGADILIYGLGALAVAAGLFFARQHRRAWGSALLGGAIVAATFPLLLLSEHVGRPALVHLYDALGKPSGYLAIGDNVASSPTSASDTVSWFGPVGFLFVTGVLIAMLQLMRRRQLTQLEGLFAFAPVAWFVLVALTLTYNPWLGRFFVFPVALSAVFWGRALRWPAVAWGAAALSAITLFLTLVHYVEKPSGLRLFDRDPAESVWTMARWQVQSRHDPALGPVFQFLDEQIPAHASIALALSENDFGYPAFGPHLSRRVEIVPEGSTARDIQTEWLVASPERAGQIDSSCWLAVFQSSGGNVYRRRPGCA
jgi:4-amino-4-deoxy-L-arabinose transferase-like glycosyltransferase